jgi:ubiquinone/menaquinone biosynthesis C-methylase UbiE
MNRIIFDIGAAYYDVVTARLTEWRTDCAELAAHLGEADRLVLDLGTGPGVSAYEIAQSNAQAVVLGVDISHTMLRRAVRNRDRYRASEQRVEFARADARSLPVRSGSVDAVTTHSALYLMPDRPTVLREIRRVLRRGGVAIFFEPRRERPAVPAPGTWVRSPAYAWTMFLWGVVGRFEGSFRDGELPALARDAGMSVRHAKPALEGYGWLVVADAPA